jgi:phosphohistidine swiveling domain-containing protein
MSQNFKRGEWIPWEQSATPFLLGLTLNAGMERLRGVIGLPLWTTIIVFEDGQARWLFRPQELKALGLRMMDYLLVPSFRASFEATFNRTEELLLKEARSVQFSTELGGLSNEQLLGVLRKLCDVYYQWYALGWFCEPIQFQTQDVLSAYLSGTDIEAKLSVDGQEAKRLLLALDEESFTLSILSDLRECAAALVSFMGAHDVPASVRVAVEQKDYEHAAGQIVEWASGELSGDALIGALKQHCASFYWKRNNYSSTTVLGPQEVLAELVAENGLDVAKTLDRLTTEIAQAGEARPAAQSKKREVLAKLPLHLREIVALVNSVGGILLDRRKRSIMIANGAFDALLGEVARRTKNDVSDIRLLLPQELEFFLSRPREYNGRFQERRERFVVFQGDIPILEELIDTIQMRQDAQYVPNFDQLFMRDPFIAEGREADRILARLNHTFAFLADTDDAESARVLQGVVAYASDADIIEGPIAIISDPKQRRLPDQYILVASSTTPDYMDAIRRCTAIITDWGGHTSHAAIVARELQKPCIIGTGYASHVLKDDEIVRLHMRTGTVERLLDSTKQPKP